MEDNEFEFSGSSAGTPPSTSHASGGIQSSSHVRVILHDEVLWIPAEVVSDLSRTVKCTLCPFWSRSESQFRCPDKTFAKIFWYLKDGAELFNRPYPREDTEAELRLDCSLYCYGRATGWTELSNVCQDRICKHWPDRRCDVFYGAFAQAGETDDKDLFMFLMGLLFGYPREVLPIRLQTPFLSLGVLTSPARPGSAHTMIEED